MRYDILVVDDEPNIRKVIADVLKDEGYVPRVAGEGGKVLEMFRSRKPDLVILDIWLNDSRYDGLQLLDLLHQEDPTVPVIMISGHGTIQTAVAALKKGAYDFIEKPFKTDRLLLMVERALEASRLRRENMLLRGRGNQKTELIGVSNLSHQLRHLIAKVAPTNSRAFISGGAGVGKELVARLIHEGSKRAEGPFVPINCATLNPERIDQELFGVDLVGPDRARTTVMGVLEKAHKGTLLLDEVVDMPMETQGKIVRVLQEQTFTRLHGTHQIEVDIRVLASSSKDIQQAIREGRFREDLYYRLSVVPIRVPSLHERREDIAALVQHFMDRSHEINGLTPKKIGDDVIAALQAYHWPGNIRQLKNLVDWLLIMVPADKQTIAIDMLPPEISSEAPAVLSWDKTGEIMALPLRDAREAFEKHYLIAQINRFSGNISQTANFVGMERSALHRKLKSLGVENDRGERSTGGGV